MKYLILIMFVAFSCKTPELPDPSLVVEAFIYEGRPVENIKLSLVNPINSESGETLVSDARVFIIWNNIYYELFQQANNGKYSSSSSRLIISTGEHYELLIQYNNDIFRSETTVPDNPNNLISSKDTLNMSSSSDFLEMTWNNPDSIWHLGVISGVNLEETEFPFNNFFSLPTKNSLLQVTNTDVQTIGNKQFILYGITEDYANLYRISHSTIGSSNAGNMSNGFGIFTAFSSDTLNIVVKE